MRSGVPALYLCLIAAGAAVPTATLAQVAPSASQVTPRTLAPEAPPAETPQVNGATAIPVPEGAADFRFRPSHVVVEGTYAGLAEETAQLTDWLKGIEISVADFYQVATTLQRLYAARGYPLARVVVPEQELNDDQPARLVVIDGYVEAVDTSSLPSALRGPVARALASLIGKRGLTYAELERRLTLAGQYPGASLRSTLATGQATGGVRLIIESGLRAVTGSIDFNDRTSPAFARREFNAQLAFNSAFGMGEQVYIFVSGDPLGYDELFGDRSPKSIIGSGLILPLGSDGFSLNLEATRSVTQPLGGFFRTRNEFSRLSARASYPLVLTRTETLSVETSLEFFDERQKLPDFDGFELSRDRYTIVRVSSSYTAQRPGSSFGARIALSAGRSNAPAGALPSRISATPGFARMEASGSSSLGPYRGLVVTSDLRLALILDGGLPNAELFGLDGPSALSPFTAGSLSADEGITGRITLRRPIAVSASFSLAPYAFVATGFAKYSVPTPFDTTRAGAWGGGVETNFSSSDGPGAYAKLEWGKQITNSFFPDRSRFVFSAGARF